MIEFKHLQKALADYATAIKDEYKDSLDKNNRRATGNLITGVNTKVVVDGNQFVIELHLEDYWYWIDNGRKAGKFPPVNKILEWIKVKPILPYYQNGKLPTENQLAYLIGRKIQNEGFEGTNDLENTMETVDYEAIIEEALDKDVLGELDELLALLA